MEPGVAFPLLAGVELLAVAALLALAAASCFRRLRGVGSAPLIIGALALAVPEAWTATQLGQPELGWLGYVRAGGAALVAIGFFAGALTRPAPVVDDHSSFVTRTTSWTLGVVAPLGLPLRPGALAVAAALVAGVAALRRPRTSQGWLFALAFVAAAAADGAALRAGSNVDAALAELALRAVSALLLLAGVARVSRFSVLGKVAAAILAGVLMMAVAAVSVVSTVLASSFTDQQRTQVTSVATGQVEGITQLTLKAQQLAKIVSLCPQSRQACQQLLSIVGGGERTFAAAVLSNGQVQQYLPQGAPASQPVLSEVDKVQLAGQEAVKTVLDGTVSAKAASIGTLITFAGRSPTLAAIGIAPAPLLVQGAPSPYAAVYGYLLDHDFVQSGHSGTGLDISLVVGGQVVASSLPATQQRELRAVVRDADPASRVQCAADGADNGGLTLDAEGDRPTVHFTALCDGSNNAVGLLAVSRSAQDVLDTERTALSDVFFTALAVTVLVGLLALLLGRGVVEPIRRLTSAASRVRRGDLATHVEIASDDEIGTLSRAFDAMTDSLATSAAELRTAAEEQSSLRGRLATVLDSMSDGVLTTDRGGVVTSANPAALALLDETTAGAVLDRPLADVVDLRGGGGAPVELPLLRGQVAGELGLRHGAAVPVRVAVAPLEDRSGTVVLLRDTRRERELERMKTEFLSNVSHELRTPLTPIRGYAEILRRRPDLPVEQTREYAETILDSSVRMTQVVDLLVDVAALEAGRVVADPQPVVVPMFLDDRLEQWRAREPARAEDLRRRAASKLPAVLIDPMWVGKAYDELVENALKYSPPGTPVILTAALSADGTGVLLGVRDSGPGISADELPGLFAAFEQADGSATRSVGGLGLGLSFVRRLAEEFDLSVRVDSVPGKGSEFALEVPAAFDVPVPPPRRAAARRHPRGGAGRPATSRGEPVRRRRQI